MDVLVIGASLNKERYSNKAICLLKQYNHKVYAYGLKSGIVCQTSIDTELINYQGIDTITMYVNPKRQEVLYAYLIGLKPRRIIFNPGTENPAFYDLLEKNNIFYEQACTLVLLGTNQF